MLIQLLLGPLITHLLLRPVLEPAFGAGLPSLEGAIDLFVDSYLRAVALPEPGQD